jgi:uncharacterized protein YbdZ (MbtH family)
MHAMPLWPHTKALAQVWHVVLQRPSRDALRPNGPLTQQWLTAKRAVLEPADGVDADVDTLLTAVKLNFISPITGIAP